LLHLPQYTRSIAYMVSLSLKSLHSTSPNNTKPVVD
jgi:hypothetical protein